MLAYVVDGYWVPGYADSSSYAVSTWLNRITSEHADKPNFMAMVAASLQPAADLSLTYHNITSAYDLRTAVGKQLDVLGQWVGVSRELTAPLAGVYFSFDTVSVGFDEGLWLGPYDVTTGLVQLPDQYYRVLIASHILDNYWDGSLIDAYILADVVFSSFGYSVFIEDLANLSIYIGLLGSAPPPAIVMALLTSGKLDIKPATVKVAGYLTQADAGPMFAFDLNNIHFAGFDVGTWATITTP